MTNRLTKILLAGTCPLMLAAMTQGAFAQSTGTQDIETVVVTGQHDSSNGLMNAAPISKERSVITNDFLNQALPSGQTVFNALNYMPGVNFTNNDPYGTSGGDIRVHGQDGNHISLTLDGMPLNDTGNYAIFTNQMVDPEIIDRVSVNQGSTDVDSPTAAATGGVIAIKSDNPHDQFGAEIVSSVGSYNDKRGFIRIDSGEFGPFGTKAYGTYSYNQNDLFAGPGFERKVELNAKVYQDLGSLGWFAIAGHWNSNRNNNIVALNYAPSTAGYSTALANSADIIHNPNGSGYVANPLPAAIPVALGGTNSTFDSVGWDRGLRENCPYTAPVAGTADQTQTTCTYWQRVRVNPSDTGNIRFQSLFNLTDKLTLTADANFQYVEATGGGTFFTFTEFQPQVIGGSVINGAATTTTPYGCIPGRGCDLNGDGDIKDTVGLQQPSLTQTHRYGANVSLIYKFDDQNTILAGYTLDWGDHRQTAETNRVNPVSGPICAFGAVCDNADIVLDATGTPLRFRDRRSYAIMNQASFDYEGKFFDESLRTSIGFRLPYFERDLNQYCYESAGSSTAYCTTQVATTANSDGTFSFAGSATHYAPPGTTVRNYSKFLPHLGLTYLPFGDEHQFFASFTQEIAAPRTDNLYTAVCTTPNPAGGCSAYNTFASTKPETSTTYQYGYRYFGDGIQLAAIEWNSQIKNRIVSAIDPITNTYFDHNVPGINFWGTDFEANYFSGPWSIYTNASYTRARISTNILINNTGGGTFAQTLNKQLSETPKWLSSVRLGYKMDDLNFGISAKYVSKRYQSEDNNASIPDYYTANADVSYYLTQFGLPNSSLRLNVDNIFNKHYFGSTGSQLCFTPQAVGATAGCTAYSTAYRGSPRIAQLSLVLRY